MTFDFAKALTGICRLTKAIRMNYPVALDYTVDALANGSCDLRPKTRSYARQKGQTRLSIFRTSQ